MLRQTVVGGGPLSSRKGTFGEEVQSVGDERTEAQREPGSPARVPIGDVKANSRWPLALARKASTVGRSKERCGERVVVCRARGALGVLLLCARCRLSSARSDY